MGSKVAASLRCVFVSVCEAVASSATVLFITLLPPTTAAVSFTFEASNEKKQIWSRRRQHVKPSVCSLLPKEKKKVSLCLTVYIFVRMTTKTKKHDGAALPGRHKGMIS